MKTPEEMAKEYVDQDKVAYAAIDDAEDLVKDAFIAGYEACKNHIHLHWKEEWKDLYKRIEESCLPAMDAMEGRYLHQVKKLETRIAELETQLENWQHNATHGDEGL